MFYGCKNLKSLDLSNFNTEFLENIDKIFYGCLNLEYINIYNFADGIIFQFDNLFHGTKDNIIYCIKNESAAEELIQELKLKKCSVNDCSSDWKN
jgi:surface protein